MMIKYGETIEALDKLGEDDLTDAELAYYTHVHTQILEKLSVVGQ